MGGMRLMLSRVMKQLHRSKKPSERLTWRKVVLPFLVPTKQAYLIDSLGLVRDIHITAFCDRRSSGFIIVYPRSESVANGFEGMERGRPRARLLYSPDFPPPVGLTRKSSDNVEVL